MSFGKLVIISGPSGSGKTTIVHHLLKTFPSLSFSVSATTRPKRKTETDGKDYHFLSEEEFRNRIEKNEFAEWEEVYHGMFYGTLKSEIKKHWSEGKAVVFDIDVVGALNLKRKYPEDSLALIIIPPSTEELKKRLHHRKTETEESLERRLGKAEEEIKLGKFFDKRLVNNTLPQAFSDAGKILTEFLNPSN